jgi:hypothetical protein
VIALSCESSAQSNLVKKKSKIVRKSNILLSARYEGKLVFYQLNLRDKHYFDIYENVLLKKEYYAGNWRSKNDTITISYIDNHKSNSFGNIITIDSLNKKLFMHRDSLPRLEFVIDSIYWKSIELKHQGPK